MLCEHCTNGSLALSCLSKLNHLLARLPLASLGLNGTDKKNRNHSFVPVIVKAKVVSVFFIVIVFLCFSDEMRHGRLGVIRGKAGNVFPCF